jgi:hypothetical protein
MSIASLASAQGDLLAGLLLLSAAAKFIASKAEINQTGFAILVRQTPWSVNETGLRLAWFGIAILEAGLAALLLMGSWGPAVGAAGLLVAAAFTGYVLWLLKAARHSSCGCFGTLSAVTWKSLARAILFTAMFVTFEAATARGSPHSSAALIVLVLSCEIAIILLLSDEIRPWLRRARLAWARVAHSLGAATTAVDAVREAVEDQTFWRNVVELSCEPSFASGWRDGRWYVLEYSGRWLGEDVLIVASEYLGAYPPWVRVVVAREEGEQFSVLASWDSAVAAQLNATDDDSSLPVSAVERNSRPHVEANTTLG